MEEKLIYLDNSKFTTLIVDPTVVYKEDRPVNCIYCTKRLFDINRKFAVIADGIAPLGVSEVPLNVFRMTRFCGQCRHYYIVYFDGSGTGL